MTHLLTARFLYISYQYMYVYILGGMLHVEVASQPALTIATPGQNATLGNAFTLMMVDADIVGTDESKGQTRHWLVNNATLDTCTLRPVLFIKIH